jgi:hypothetical protein
MASICSRLIRRSCITALLSSKRLEGDALEARDLGLEEAEVHQTRTLEVLTLGVVDAGAVDPEESHRTTVDQPDDDVAQLTAAHEPEGTEEQVIGLEHACLPWTGRAGLS